MNQFTCERCYKIFTNEYNYKRHINKKLNVKKLIHLIKQILNQI